MVNNELHKLWIKGFLKRLGKRNPLILSDLVKNFPFTQKEKQIILLRYIENKTWDEISDLVFLSKSRVMQLHKKCIAILENLAF